jgi:hypothetical protein
MLYKEIEAEYRHSIVKLEEEMQKEFKEQGLEFLFDKGDCKGIQIKGQKQINKELLEG